MRRFSWILICVVGVVQAEVLEVSPSGFVSEHKLVLATTPGQAFTALTKDVALWWDAGHSYGGKASAFSMQLSEGGCFCEVLAGGGFVEHMRVVHVRHGRQITLQGGLGPLQSMGVAGSMVFSLDPQGQQTLLTYRYTVGGFSSGALQNLAEPVDRVQLGQLRRLQQYVATGEPLN